MARKQPGGVPARQVAKYAGLSHSALSSILRGENGPRFETTLKLAEYFGEDARYVASLAGYSLPGEGEPEPVPFRRYWEPALRRLSLKRQEETIRRIEAMIEAEVAIEAAEREDQEAG